MGLLIIIVNWNTKDLLNRCLRSVVKNTDPKILASSEIVVVDNGSSDSSVDEVKKLITNNQSAITIRLIANKSNLGFAKAVNQGLRLAQGKVALLLNSDTQVKKDALEKLLEFEKEHRPVVVGPKLVNPDGSPQASVFRLPTVWGAIKEYWLGQKGEYSKYLPAGGEPVAVESVVGGAMMISGEIISKVGFFDERYFMYFEDLDYCRRVLRAGYKVYYLPGAEVIHEHGASGNSLVGEVNQWRRLIPSSKVYHGRLKHLLISLMIRLGLKVVTKGSGS